MAKEALGLPQFDRGRPGCLYARGVADAWYDRTPSPHWYPQGNSGPVERAANAEERAEYMAGYESMVAAGGRKEWD